MPADPAHYMRLALDEARKSPPKPTNYCVGAVLVDPLKDEVLSTGYTLELPGNTHAEQCCLQKLASKVGVAEEDLGLALPPVCAIYTTMEPCIERLSGNLPCVDRIIRTAQRGHGTLTVYSGVHEPDTFVQKNSGKAKLAAAGIEFVHIPGFEEEILAVATAGHEKASNA